MVNKLSLEDGLKRVFELGDAIESDPVVVAINGGGNCGKTYTAQRLYEMCQERGLGAYRELNENPNWRSDSRNYVFLEDWALSKQDDNRARRILGKGIDIRVLVDNPEITGGVPQYLPNVKFDVHIINPHSHRK